MKIAIVSPEFPPDIGGVETYAFEFCRELARQGHAVTVFTQRHAEDEAALPGLEVVPGLSFAQASDLRLFDTREAADLFVLAASIVPGSHEGFGIVYLEAAASGLPGLAARLAGAAEAVAEGESGHFVEEPGEDAIAEALERFLSGGIRFDPERCRASAHRFTWAGVVTAADAAYWSAISP
jgi:glycosyltransferase involved in cell wall biosynthesis